MQTSKIGWSKVPVNSSTRLSGDQAAGGQRRVHGYLFGNMYGNAFAPLEGDAQGLEVPRAMGKAQICQRLEDGWVPPPSPFPQGRGVH